LLNSDATVHGSSGNAGKRNCRSNKTADCLEVPKTGVPKRRRPRRRRSPPEVRRREVQFRRQRRRRLSPLANSQAQPPSAQWTRMPEAPIWAGLPQQKNAIRQPSLEEISALSPPLVLGCLAPGSRRTQRVENLRCAMWRCPVYSDPRATVSVVLLPRRHIHVG
jgi:hypothetical protein